MTLRVRVPVKWLLMRLCWCSVISYSRTTQSQNSVHRKSRTCEQQAWFRLFITNLQSWWFWGFSQWERDFSWFQWIYWIQWYSQNQWYMNQGYFKDPFSVCDLVVEWPDVFTPEVIQLLLILFVIEFSEFSGSYYSSQFLVYQLGKRCKIIFKIVQLKDNIICQNRFHGIFVLTH